METARLTWCHPFEHWSTQSAFSSQIDQNALDQPWVDWESNEFKILPKQHLSCFYIKLKSLGDFCQLWPTLTWSWLPKALNFDPTIWMGWNQFHCKECQIPFPTIAHGSKSKLRIEISQKPCGAHQHTSKGHNFWSNHRRFNFFSVLETRHPQLSKDIKINSIWVKEGHQICDRS